MPEYRATSASAVGGFKVDGRRAALLPGPIDLNVSSDDDERRVDLHTGYDPPGSGWYALLASVGTVIVVVAVSSAEGAVVAPGWLVWYVIITLARRRRVTLNLLESDSVRIDDKTRRLAFEPSLDGRKTWVAFQVKEGFEQASDAVRTLLGDKLRDGRVSRAGTAFFVVIGVLVLLMAALIVWSLTM